MYKCDCCGLCCMHVEISLLENNFDRGDGICKYFVDESHLCSIYDHRPTCCNVDLYYDAVIKEQLTREEYYRINYLACKNLKERFGE